MQGRSAITADPTPAEPLVYETHMHTPLCNHATGTPAEYADVARERGLKGIIVTCHNPLPGGYASSSRMALEQFGQYLEMVAQARESMAGIVEVRLGLEGDFVPGMEAWLERQFASAEFDYILGSVHPQMSEYREAFWTGNALEFQMTYFDHLVAAAESGLYDSLSHPDLVKNIAPDEWDYRRVEGHILRSLDRIAATGIAMELNTSGLNKAIPEMNPSPRILSEMHERGIPVVVGADAHVPQRVADRYDEAYRHLLAAGYTHVSYVLNRERRDVPIERALASLRLAPS
ncbi:MAG: histidinol-phosphatase [Trueperaceae bacterium]